MAAPPFSYAGEPFTIQAAASEGLFTAYQFVMDDVNARREYIKRNGYNKYWFSVLKELNLGSPSSIPRIWHWERERMQHNFLVGAITAPPAGPGAPMVVTLDADSMYVETLYGTAVPFSRPQEHDIITLPTGERATITNKDPSTNPHTVTITPNLAATDLGALITAGDRLWISDNARGEGTDQVLPLMPRWSRYENAYQIIKSTFVETGSSLTNSLPFRQIDGTQGSFLIIGSEIADEDQLRKISNALFFGRLSDNIFDTTPYLNFDPPAKTTQGVDDYIEGEGTILGYTPGAFSIDDFSSMSEVLQRNVVNTTVVLMPVGFQLRSEINDTMIDFVSNSCFDWAVQKFPGNPLAGWTMGSSPEDFFIWLDFHGIHKDGYSFLLRTQPEFSNPMEAGTAGYPWPQVGYAIPVEIFTDREQNDVASVGYEYKALNGYSRELEIWEHGGAGPIKKTGPFDVYNLELRSEIGAHNALGYQMIKISPEPVT